MKVCAICHEIVAKERGCSRTDCPNQESMSPEVTGKKNTGSISGDDERALLNGTRRIQEAARDATRRAAFTTAAILAVALTVAAIMFGSGDEKSVQKPPMKNIDTDKNQEPIKSVADTDGHSKDSKEMRWLYKNKDNGGPMALYGPPDSDAFFYLECSSGGIVVSRIWSDDEPFRSRSILTSGGRRFESQATLEVGDEWTYVNFVVPYGNAILTDMSAMGFAVSYDNISWDTLPNDPIVMELISSCI